MTVIEGRRHGDPALGLEQWGRRQTQEPCLRPRRQDFMNCKSVVKGEREEGVGREGVRWGVVGVRHTQLPIPAAPTVKSGIKSLLRPSVSSFKRRGMYRTRWG